MTLKYIRLTAAAGLLVSMFPVSLHAEETEEILYTPETVTVSAEDYGETNDEMLTAYLERSIFEENISDEAEYTEETYDAMAGSGLTGMDRRMYFACLPKIREVSSGQTTNTVFEFTPEDLGLEFGRWTAEELGVETVLVDGDTVPADAYNALLEKEGARMNDLKLVFSLLDNHAFDLYWFDKTEGVNISRFGVRIGFRDGEPVVRLSGTYTLSFTVAKDFRKDKYETDPAVIETIQGTPDKVRTVVSRHADEDDRQKLDSYRQEIIDLTDYNEEAMKNPESGLNNPWQLIWVFDDNPDTKVVCEGYTKAFQYLCELSDFSTGVNSTIVSGPITYNGTKGPHMWNVVTMEDGENYIADITNCDEGMAGMYDRLFLVGGKKQEDGSYQVDFPDKEIGDLIYYGGTITYEYNEGTQMAYDASNVLNIADHNYMKAQNVSEGKCGDDLSWKLDDKGVLTITGTGRMDDYSEESPSPWNKESIRKVIVNAGAENIGRYAFAGCTNLNELQIPSSVTVIGNSAVSDCTSFGSLIYNGYQHELNEIWVENNNDPFLKAKAYVTLLAPVAKTIEIRQGESAEIPTRDTLQLNAVLTPEGSDNTVRWYTSDEKVASVSESGVITANTYGKTTITAVSADNPTLKASFQVQTRFFDVNDSTQSYYKPVYWGADNGVVAGYNGGEYFGPDNVCTRAQFVTFLWRLAGKPEGKKAVNFKDIDKSVNYYRAVKWAVSKGIIVGYKDDNTFRPDNEVTRGQVAVMLWRFAGKKTPKLPDQSPFSDIDASNSSYRAVVWGQKAGVIKGYKTGEYAGQFRADDSCLRQHIVTFLYRYARDVMK